MIITELITLDVYMLPSNGRHINLLYTSDLVLTYYPLLLGNSNDNMKSSPFSTCAMGITFGFSQLSD